MKNRLNVIFEMLRADGSIIVNKRLARRIGLDCAIMYSELLSKFLYFKDRGNLTADGFFFNTIDDMERDTTINGKHQRAAIKILVEIGLIECDVRGLPATRHFRIIENEDIILDLMSDERTQQDTQLFQNGTTGCSEMEQLDRPKWNLNNTKQTILNNNTKEDQNIAANAESKKTNTLFPMPDKQEKSSPPRIPSKIERAEQTGKWEDVTPTDFVDYFVDRHNELFPSPICRQKSQVGNFLVKMFRVNFMERFQIPPNELCSKIDLILRTYKRIETNPEYKDCFDLATFKHGRVIDKLMQSARYEDQYGSSIKSTSTAKNNSEIF